MGGRPKVNAKRVLRIMQVERLTLERITARRPGRTHEGAVVALRSNIRWCSVGNVDIEFAELMFYLGAFYHLRHDFWL